MRASGYAFLEWMGAEVAPVSTNTGFYGGYCCRIDLRSIESGFPGSDRESMSHLDTHGSPIKLENLVMSSSAMVSSWQWYLVGNSI